MNEYKGKAVAEEVYEYREFVRQTGLSYKDIYRLHTEAVKAVDDDRGIPGFYSYPTAITQIYSHTLAALTDIALKHLALAAAIDDREEVYLEDKDL